MNAGINLLFILILGGASLTDIRRKRIPNFISTGGYLLLLLVQIFTGNTVLPFLIPSLISFTVMATISLISRNKLGMGDAKLSLSIGGMLGIYYWLLSLFLASLTALLFAFTRMSAGKMQKSDSLPFAPFLSLGALLTLWLKGRGYFY